MSSVRVRAPQNDLGLLVEPGLTQIPTLLARNRQQSAAFSCTFLGRSFADLRQAARQSLLHDAQAYLLNADEPVPTHNTDVILMAGHQPELFHPGVWIKNFALHALAQHCGAAPVNLVVDNDTAKHTALTVPQVHLPLPIRAGLPTTHTVAFDVAATELPYEEARVQDEALFASLPERVPTTTWNFTPMLAEFWATVCQQAARTSLIGERLAAARRVWERAWGCHNWEVPVSAVCQAESYAWFAAHLLSELPRFHALYNGTVQAYRRRYGLRSRHHPVPDLAVEGDWLETPFWGWRGGAHRRGRLMARVVADRIELRVGTEAWPTLSRQAPTRLIADWLALGAADYKVRSRALTNTLYARLFLTDLFVHGIGGGKYDELTDELLRDFYGVEPPSYVILSATVRLPFPNYPVEPTQCQRHLHHWRDLLFNPQRHLSGALGGRPDALSIVAQKQAWLARPCATRRERRERFRQLRQLTEQLRILLTDEEHTAQRAWQDCQALVQANAVLQQRDYAFCLYPVEKLRSFFAQVGAEIAALPQ